MQRVLGLLCVVLGLLARPATLHAEASSAAPEGQIAAEALGTVLGEPVLSTSLTPTDAEVRAQRERLDEAAYAEWRRSFRAQALDDMAKRMWSRLFDAYIEEHALAPTEAELAQYAYSAQETYARATAELEAQLEVLRERLRDPDLDPAERTQLETLIANVEETLAYQRQPERNATMAAIERDITRGMLRRWKLDKALYEHFGGRIIFQQAGLEPVDAYEQFLRAEEAAGRVTFASPELKAAFYRYFTLGHNYLDRVGDLYFRKPWWTWTPEEQAAFDRAGG